MTLEQQVISLSLTKRLKELGVKQGSIYYWRGVSNNTAIEPENWVYSWRIVRSDETVPEHSNNARLRIYPAFTVAELGELLPKGLPGQNGFPGTALHIGRTYDDKWFCGYSWLDDRTLPASHDWDWCEKEDTEAEARGLMLAYLLESKLLDL